MVESGVDRALLLRNQLLWASEDGFFGGHNAWLEYPAEVAKAVNAFIARLG
jgi:hypothetical protein